MASWSLVLSATKFTASTQQRISGAAAPRLWQRAAAKGESRAGSLGFSTSDAPTGPLGPPCSPVQAPCLCLCPSNTSSLRGFFRISSSARSKMPSEDARLGVEVALGASGDWPEPKRRGSKSNKTWGGGGDQFQAPPPAPGSPPSPHPTACSTTHVAQPQGPGMSGGCPQRHIQHKDAVRDNERGNHHDEKKVPEDPRIHDVTAHWLL